jgi:cobalt-zinc-cadmium resistance protein CzcA
MEVSRYENLKKAEWRLDAIDLQAEYGQINSGIRDFKISINQNIHLPPELRANADEMAKTVSLKESERDLLKKNLEREIRLAYSDWLLSRAALNIAIEKDSLYSVLAGYAVEEYRLGNRSKVEAQVLEAEKVKTEQEKYTEESNIIDAYSRLRTLFCVAPGEVPGEKAPLVFQVSGLLKADSLQTPGMRIAEKELDLSIARWNMERSQRWPEINLGYFNQSIDGTRNFSGVQGGLAIPLWFWSDKSRIEAARIGVLISENNMRQVYYTENERIISLRLKYMNLLSNYQNYKDRLLPVADDLEESAHQSYKSGQLSFSELIMILNQVWDYRSGYLKSIKELNNLVLELNSLTE